MKCCLPLGSSYLNGQPAAFLFSVTINIAQKNEISEMIKSKNGTNRSKERVQMITIETNRLLLRNYRVTDFEDIIKYFSVTL